MQRKTGDFAWAVAWLAAAGLALLLFSVMSLLAVRSARSPGAVFPPAPGITLAPDFTPAPGAGGAGTPDVSAAGEAETPHPGSLPMPEAQAAPDPTATIGLWLSAISAITALVGLISSLWLGWRKERRESAQHQLELERTQLEVDKLRRELAGLRQHPGAGPDAAP